MVVQSEEQLTSTPSRLGIAWSSLGGSRKQSMTPSPVTAQARVKSVFGAVPSSKLDDNSCCFLFFE